MLPEGPVKEVLPARLTDFALETLHDLVKIPKTFATRLEPHLHATNLNELRAKRVSPVTLTVERNGSGDNRGSAKPKKPRTSPS